MKDKIFSYGVVLGKRFTEKQKKNFLFASQIEFQDNGLESDVFSSNLNLKMNQTLSHYNLYIGDVEKADIVISTYYDTGTKHFIKSDVKAFTTGLDKKNYILQIVLSLLLFAGLVYTDIRFFTNGLFVDSGILSFASLLFLIMNAIGIFVISKVGRGVPNRTNFIRNTSSILSIFELSKQLRGKRIAYALLDGGCSTNYGMQMLKDKVSKRTKIVYLDSIGNPGDIQVFSKRKIDVNGIQSHALDNADLADILITFGKLKNNEVIIPNANTSKDNEIKLDVFESNTKELSTFIEELIS